MHALGVIFDILLCTFIYLVYKNNNLIQALGLYLQEKYLNILAYLHLLPLWCRHYKSVLNEAKFVYWMKLSFDMI